MTTSSKTNKEIEKPEMNSVLYRYLKNTDNTTWKHFGAFLISASIVYLVDTLVYISNRKVRK